jgi:hypothetical protein
MSNDQKPNPLIEILKRKKINNQGKFNPNQGNSGKPQKGFGGSAVVRKTGRGR